MPMLRRSLYKAVLGSILWSTPTAPSVYKVDQQCSKTSWNPLTSWELNLVSSQVSISLLSFSSSCFRFMARKSCKKTQKFTSPSTTPSAPASLASWHAEAIFAAKSIRSSTLRTSMPSVFKSSVASLGFRLPLRFVSKASKICLNSATWASSKPANFLAVQISASRSSSVFSTNSSNSRGWSLPSSPGGSDATSMASSASRV
mmetsp:Transcript_497/g.1369  ORF Transcript_497/g.1369 Transcript_497/m.1369 type:complete len:202 (+) Transcript_497:90-695(+)